MTVKLPLIPFRIYDLVAADLYSLYSIYIFKARKKKLSVTYTYNVMRMCVLSMVPALAGILNQFLSPRLCPKPSSKSASLAVTGGVRLDRWGLPSTLSSSDTSGSFPSPACSTCREYGYHRKPHEDWMAKFDKLRVTHLYPLFWSPSHVFQKTFHALCIIAAMHTALPAFIPDLGLRRKLASSCRAPHVCRSSCSMMCSRGPPGPL